jgi:hypothetical protein
MKRSRGNLQLKAQFKPNSIHASKPGKAVSEKCGEKIGGIDINNRNAAPKASGNGPPTNKAGAGKVLPKALQVLLLAMNRAPNVMFA